MRKFAKRAALKVIFTVSGRDRRTKRIIKNSQKEPVEKTHHTCASVKLRTSPVGAVVVAVLCIAGILRDASVWALEALLDTLERYPSHTAPGKPYPPTQG